MKNFFKLLSLVLAIVLLVTGCSPSIEEDDTTTTTEAVVSDDDLIDLEGNDTSAENNIIVDDGIDEEGWFGEEDTTVSAGNQQSGGSQSTKPPVTETTTKKQSTMPATTQEIIDYFNTSANRVKNEAKRVTKNYEKRNVSNLVLPSKSLESVADELMKKYLSDDTEPIYYDTHAEIQENYMVPEQSYSSRVTLNAVSKATITDLGDEYEIQIYLNSEENPRANVGIGAICDVIEASEVSQVGFVKSFTTFYHDCVVKAKINKETGRMSWSNYYTPVDIDATVNMFGTHNVSVELSFEKDYTITY